MIRGREDDEVAIAKANALALQKVVERQGRRIAEVERELAARDAMLASIDQDVAAVMAQEGVA